MGLTRRVLQPLLAEAVRPGVVGIELAVKSRHRHRPEPRAGPAEQYVPVRAQADRHLQRVHHVLQALRYCLAGPGSVMNDRPTVLLRIRSGDTMTEHAARLFDVAELGVRL